MNAINLSHNFEAAYKKRKSGKLIWITCFANSSKEADAMMDAYILERHGSYFRRYAGALKIRVK